jgi:hypothetical protein
MAQCLWLRETVMRVSTLLKFHRYAFAWENYLLLGRALYAAWLVRRHLGNLSLKPGLKAALPAIDALYLPPQPDWRISDAEKIARFASFAVQFPIRWGHCLQQSLILYRLLNGYGIPARLCFGLSRAKPETDGHAWVAEPGQSGRALMEADDPRAHFTPIYFSPLPVRALSEE